MSVLLIENKDYPNDNYYIGQGNFATDLVVVSALALTSSRIETNFYAGIPDDKYIKWVVTPQNGSSTVIYKAPYKSCSLIPQNSFSTDIRTSLYSVQVSSVTATSVLPDGSIYDPEYDSLLSWLSPSSLVVGGRGSSGSTNAPGVHPCLVVPFEEQPAGNRTFNIFTLSGGVESVRVYLTQPPSATVTVTVADTLGGSNLQDATYTIYNHELSSKVINTVNNVDQWYVDVQGYMFPNQTIPNDDQWNLGWTFESDSTNEQITAAYLHSNNTDIYNNYYKQGLISELGNPVGKVLELPNFTNYRLDKLRVFFSEPGIKKIKFYNIKDKNESDNSMFSDANSNFIYELNTRFLNNENGIRVNFVSADFSGVNDEIVLSAVSFFDNGVQDIFLDSTFPNIAWKWESIYADSLFNTPMVATSLKTGLTISQGSYLNATNNDTIKFISQSPAIHSISAYKSSDPSVINVYTWQTFTPDSVFLKYNYNNCLENRTVQVSALTQFRGEDVLFKGQDNLGNPIAVLWNWSTNNVNGFSTQRGIPKNTLIQAEGGNPVTFLFNNPSTLIRTLCSTTFSVSTNSIATNNYDEIDINYDLKPQGYGVDLILNNEKASEINNTFYRIVPDSVTTYSVAVQGLIKPDTNSSWLTGGQLNNLPNALTKLLYYYNDDFNTVKGNGGTNVITFDLNSHNYHLSSITFVASCLSASPVFGYGHNISKTVNIRVYKDSFVPELCSIVFPEYKWNLPSTPALSSLLVNPNAYWSYSPKPYPSAYGEGFTNTFIASAFGLNDLSFYDDFSWSVGNYNKVLQESFIFDVQSQPNQTKNLNLIIGAFNSLPSISLLNTSLSTYKDDTDGSIKVFKNWKQHEFPIIIKNYDNSISQNINSSYRIINGDTIIYTLTLNVIYPEQSPVSINQNLSRVDWSVFSDKGDNFSATVNGSLSYEFSFNLNEKDINTITINAVANLAEYIPNYSPFILNYEPRFVNYNIPEVQLNVSFINFTLISPDKPYAVFDTGTDNITAFAPITLSGYIDVPFDNYNLEWTFNNISTGSTLLTTLDSSQNNPDEFIQQVIPVTLEVSSGPVILQKTKNLILNPSFDLQWRVFSDNIFALTSQETMFFNDSKGLIPLSSFIYKFEDENETVQLDYGENLYKTFETFGSKNLYVTAFDINGFIYEKRLNNIISVVNQWVNYIPNIFSSEDLELKNSFDEIKIKPNEWVVSDVINNSFNKIYENLTFLEDVSKFYDKPPYQLLGWLGSYKNNITWNLYPHDSNFNFVSDDTNNLEDLVSYNIIDNDITILSYKTKIQILKNSYNSDVLIEKEERSVNDSFFDIKNTVVDKEGNIIILDSFNFGTVTIFKYDPLIRNSFKYIAKFGGLGSKDSKNKFNRANDISIDFYDNLFVSDTGNRVIKKLTRTGGWLKNISSPIFESQDSDEEGSFDNNSVISASGGKNNLVYALTKDYVVIFDDDEQINSFLWRDFVDDSNLTPLKIVASSDDNIFYIVCEEKICKFTKDGYFIGYIGEYPEEYNTNIQNLKYKNLIHKDSKVLHVVSNNFVLKYCDIITFLFIKPDIKNYWWQNKEVNIHPEEFVDYWVYNKVLSRLWDNMDYFRNSLQARVLFFEDFNGKLIFKLYKRDDIYKLPFKYSKDEILIGVNEIVTADVVNRCLERLHLNCLELLNMITSQDVRYRWLDTIQVGRTPLRWYETKSDEKKPLVWNNAIS